MSKRVDFIKIVEALEEAGCEVIEIKDGPHDAPSSARALSAIRSELGAEKLSITVWPCYKED